MIALDRGLATLAADRLKVFAQPQRLMILSALLEGEMSVGAIDAATAVGQPALSQQLAGLRRASLVAQRRAAKQVLYRLADDRVAAIVGFVAGVFGHGSEPPAALQPPAGTVPNSDPSAAMFAVIDR